MLAFSSHRVYGRHLNLHWFSKQLKGLHESMIYNTLVVKTFHNKSQMSTSWHCAEISEVVRGTSMA